MSTKIQFPSDSSLEKVFAFADELCTCDDSDEIILDFSSMGRIEPFAIVYLAKIIKDQRNNKKDVKFKVTGHKQKEYAANMGFFKAFGLNFGRAINCHEGTDNFIPYSEVVISSIDEDSRKEHKKAQEILENKSKKMSQILSRSDSGILVDYLTFSIREILRNVYEHSSSEKIRYCSQYWPTYSLVEVAISDDGIGLKNSISKNPYVRVENDSEAIQMALMPGVSSKKYKGIPDDRDDYWQNSGFGLYMCCRICGNGGDFLICSGNHAILINSQGKKHYALNHEFSGTFVRLKLETSQLINYKDALKQFGNEGMKLAKKFSSDATLSASKASLLLSRDFKSDSDTNSD
jgi:hypothetical protein